MKFVLLGFLLSFNYLYAQAILPLSPNDYITSLEKNFKYEEDNPKDLLVFRGFIINYNSNHHIPLTVYHCLSYTQICRENHIAANRRSSFFVDDLHKNINSALNSDYKNSGYDRGHLVPAGDFYWNQQLKNETFTLTNIAPQTPQLNRGVWNNIESIIRNRVLRSKSDAYIITGTIIIGDDTIGNTKVTVPDYCYKIAYFPKDSTAFSFLLPNIFSQYDKDLCVYLLTIDDIEKITKTDFFEKLDDHYEYILESELYDISVLLNEK